MKSRPASLFLILILPVLVAPARRGKLLGGWETITDVRDPHVQEIAKFAVTEHNMKSKDELVFEAVVRGESQVVAGINYRLTISAKGSSLIAKYEAVVYEKAWENFKELTSFKKLSDSPVKP